MNEPGSADKAASADKAPADTTPATRMPDSYTFAFVKLGPLNEGPFHEIVAKPTPALLAELWEEDEAPAKIRAEVVRAFGTLEKRWDEADEELTTGSIVLEAEAIEKLGYKPPEGPIWLLSPCGPVRAEIEHAVLSWYTWAADSIELSWALKVEPGEQDCPDKGAWSQIAVRTEALPANLRYREAVERKAAKLEAKANPYAAVTDPIVAAAVAQDNQPTEVWLRELVIPGTDLVELTTALVRRVPGEECEDDQTNTVRLGRAGDAGLAVIAVGDPNPLDDGELRGAFVLGDAKAEVVWTVHQSWGQAVVVDVRGAAKVETITVANFHPEEFGEPVFSQIEYCGP